MLCVTYSVHAKQDLLDLWRWIAANDLPTADAVFDRIEIRIRALGAHAELGSARPDIGEDARCLIVERWLVLYRIRPTDIQVVRIVDGVRELSRLGWPSRD